MTNSADKTDLKVLELLTKNSKLTTKEISKKTLIPITTVHNRIKKLENLGIIKSYTAILDHQKLGKPLAAYVAVTVGYNTLRMNKMTQHELARLIKQNPAVEEVCMISGVFDMMVKIRVETVQQLDDFVTVYLRNLCGVSKTQTMLVLNETPNAAK